MLDGVGVGVSGKVDGAGSVEVLSTVDAGSVVGAGETVVTPGVSYEGVAGKTRGVLDGSGAASIARRISSSTPAEARLNSRIDFPSPFASSGNFWPPKSSRMAKKISISSGVPTSNRASGVSSKVIDEQREATR